MIVFGADPALVSSGWGIVETTPRMPRVLSFGNIRTKTGPIDLRMDHVRREIDVLRKRFPMIDAFAIEDQEPGRRGAFFAGIREPKADQILRVVEAFEGAFSDLPRVRPTPKQVDAITGYQAPRGVSHAARRKARKKHTRLWVVQWLGVECSNNDQADALAVAVTGERHHRMNLLREQRRT